jgi:hypothetical protein
MAILTPKTFTSGEVLTASDVNAYLRGGYMGSVYFTSSGTFTKATYPWLKAIRVKVVAGGGGGGGCDYCGVADAAAAVGGGGGCYAESFITDIASLASSVTVTIGSGGAGGTGGTSGSPSGTTGTSGGDSEFGAGTAYEVSAGGGNAGNRGLDGASFLGNDGVAARRVGTGDLVIGATATESSFSVGTTDSTFAMANASAGGASMLGVGGRGGRRRNQDSAEDGANGSVFGGGGGGGATTAQTTATNGANGGTAANGIVIVEMYA